MTPGTLWCPRKDAQLDPQNNKYPKDAAEETLLNVLLLLSPVADVVPVTNASVPSRTSPGTCT